MLRATASNLTPFITRIFNTSIRTGEMPTDWKVALIAPIPKGGDKLDPKIIDLSPFCQ